MAIFIAILLSTIIYIYCSHNIAKQRKEFEVKERQSETISTTFLLHLNGHPYLQPNDVITLQLRENKTIYIENKDINTKTHKKSNFIGNEILISQLIKYESKTETEIRRDVTLTRLIALGIFAFGIKKKTETNTQYLILTYIDNGVEVTCVFKQMQDKQELGSIVSNINRMRIESNNIKSVLTNN